MNTGSLSRAALRVAVAVSVWASAGCARVVALDDYDAAFGWEVDVPFNPFGDDAPPGVREEFPEKPDPFGDAATRLDVRRPGDAVAAADAGVRPAADAGGGGACGQIGRDCCAGARCGTGLQCAAGACVEAPVCGTVARPCCGTAACGPGLSCQGAVCVASSTCGGAGQACCAGVTSCVAALACVSGLCVACGNVGQACCTGTPGCNGALVCSGGWCRR